MEKVLEFTSIGNAIISELLKISQLIPNEFKTADNKKYDEIIMDFKYFRIIDSQEKKIENDEHLNELDGFIRDSYSKILSRFYLAFESIYEYGIDLKNFIRDINEGIFIQTTLDSIFQDQEARQLICESLYLYAVMLIVLDVFIPGDVREKLLVGYYRYNSQNTDSSIDDVCKFCRSTGYNPQNTTTPIIHFQPSTAGYPENLFSRVPLDNDFVNNVIETLKSEDIYHQMQKFPLAEHRTVALSTQASMLFACLYFQPDILNNQHSRMREICDKFYYNNWIISIYMGLTVNLFDAWDGYKAAKGALVKILEPQMIKEITVKNQQTLKRVIESTRGLLKEGVLKEEFLLKNLEKIVKVIRECNFTARWWILNSSNIYTKKSKHFYDLIRNSPNFNVNDQYDLILNTSQLELIVKEIAKDLLDNKETKWNNFKADAKEKLAELNVFFSGEALTVLKIEKNEKLQSWFVDISKEIDTLDLKQKPRAIEKKLIQMIEAFSEVQEYHNFANLAHPKQRLNEVISILNSMIHLLNIKDTILIDLQTIGDFSYAWYLIEDFTGIIHASLQKTPNILIKLRSLFIKLATALEIPLMRINQYGGAEEFVSITRYYSNELVKYVRKIVQIIPHSIFNLLKSIIYLQTNDLKEIPERLEKDKVKEFAQLAVRQEIAKLTFNISVFTDGIMAMEKTLVGVIELDPKQLLEDGIRKELVKHVAEALNEVLQFNEKPQKNSKDLLVIEKLNNLSKIMKGFRSTFEYVQDYLNIKGLLIWKEEIMRIINFNVEQECNTFKKKKLQFSQFQSDSIPIPTFMPCDTSVTFIGRLAREILKITDSKNTIYVDLLTSWYDVKTHQEIIDQKFTNLLMNSVDVHGLAGIDKLYSFMISEDLECIHKNLLKQQMKEKQWTELFQKFKTDLDGRKSNVGKNENPFKHYQVYINKCNKGLPNILTQILSIGQKVIWRCHIAHELVTSSRINCRNLVSSLSAFNDALLYELKCHELDNKKPKPSAELLLEVNKHLEMVGLYNPIEKVYIKMTKNSNEFLTFVVIFALSNLNRLAFGKNLLKFNKTSSMYGPAIMKHRKNIIDIIHSSKYVDGHVFVLGILALLRQFYENNYLIQFIDLFGQCLLEMLEYNLCSKHDLSLEITNGIDLIEAMLTLTELPRNLIEENIPKTLLDHRDYLLSISPNIN